MSTTSVHAIKALENSYVNPKEATLDKAFTKNLLRSANALSSKAENFSNFSQSTYTNLRKLLSSDLSQILAESEKQQAGEDDNCAQTDMLLSLLVSGIKMRIGDIKPPVESCDVSSCSICLELLRSPVTFKCGHSACKKCAVNSTHCGKCNAKITKISSSNVNVLLSSILQNLFPFKYVGMNLIDEGDELLQKNRVQDAINKYSEAIHLLPDSCSLTAKRAKAYAMCKDFEFAIQDCERIGFVAKDWAKCHATKTEIFQLWGKDEEALMNCLLCAAIEPSPVTSMRKADSIASKIISAYKKSSKDVRKCSKRSGGENADIPNRKSRKTCDDSAEGSSNDVDVLGLTEGLAANIASDFLSMCDTPENSDVTSETKIDDELCMIDAGDLECSLCMRLFYEPVCTPCGHLFCKRCLERTLDHGVQCPLCKSDLQESAGSEIFHPSVDTTSEAIIKKFLPLEYEFTVQQHQEEVRQLKETIPLFVCTLAFPSVPCPLHVYEPRYRLMLRRVLDIHGREFGMCLYSDTEQYHKIGTMLNVEKASFFHDGRSVVQSVGTRRFTVIEKKSCDGYDTGKVEYIIDEKVEDPVQLEKLKKLCIIVYSKSKDWYQKLQPRFKEPIVKHFGDFPTFDNSMGDNGPNWTWWVLAVLPLEDKMKIAILGKKKLLERLLLINKIITRLSAKQSQQQ